MAPDPDLRIGDAERDATAESARALVRAIEATLEATPPGLL